MPTLAAQTVAVFLIASVATACDAAELPAGRKQELPVGEELIDVRQGHVVRPANIPPTPQLIRQLQLPTGFQVNVFATDLGAPRMLAVAPDGTAYVTRRNPGDVIAMRDTDGDGRAERIWAVVEGIADVHGIAIHNGRMYLADVHNVYVADMNAEGIGQPRQIISGLPPGGRHPNRTLAVGPDGKLYITVGSTCNCCIEEYEESATILQANLDGSNRRIFARGLRNTLGIGWHPLTKEMWGMDNGTDWLGDKQPPEELNRLMDGQHYGWPFVHGDNQLIELKTYPEGFDPQAWLARSTPSVLEYTAHTSPLQLAFYTAEEFPAEYRNDAFVCMHGSWNRQPPAGYEIIRVNFNDQGSPRAIEPFLSGFLVRQPQAESEWAYFGRPAGIALTPDGALLFSDDVNGVIYRIRYVGNPKR